MKLIIFSVTDSNEYEQPGVVIFPILDEVPRVGDKIEVLDNVKKYFRLKKLPTALKVKDVIWCQNKVVKCLLTIK